TLGPIFGSLGGAFGGGNIFRTPGTFPGAVASAFATGGGGGISAPASISSAINQFFGPSVPRRAGSAGGGGGIDDFFGAGVPRTAGNLRFPFSSLGKSLSGLAPSLGLSLGSSVGGQSTAGSILGSAGGLLGGLVLAASTGAIGGSLGGLFALSGALGPAA